MKNKDKILGYASMLTNENIKVNELEIFNKNKKYVYDKKMVLKDEWKKELYEFGYSTKFVNEADGKEVEVVDEYNGIIKVFNKTYRVDCTSCRERIIINI